jgi:hypothetical protein
MNYCNSSEENSINKSSNENYVNESRKKNIEMLKIIQLSSQELLKLKGNEEFYDNTENSNKFINIISGKSQISIRLIDHFITKYSKYNKCNYKLNENQKENIFNVYFDYKSQLKHYQKIHFDPFSRGDRIPFFMGDTCIITTIGQLNFFRWFISKKIFDYLLNKKDEVFEDMNIKNKNDKKVINKCLKQVKIKNKHINDIQKKPLIINNNIEKKITNIVVSFM